MTLDDPDDIDLRLDRPSHGLCLRAHEPLPGNTRQVVHGTPITPASRIATLAPTSFCLCYASRRSIQPYLDRLAPDGLLLLDNGAFPLWMKNRKAVAEGRPAVVADAAYWRGFYEWAMPILRSVPQAHLVIPDQIEGDEHANRELMLSVPIEIPLDRCIAVWHTGDSLQQLAWIASGFGHIAFGSTGPSRSPGTLAWRQRIHQAMSFLEGLCADEAAGLCRPRIHMLRGLGPMREGTWSFASGDSTALARNHHLLGQAGAALMQQRLEARRYLPPPGPVWPLPNHGTAEPASPIRKALQLPLFQDA